MHKGKFKYNQNRIRLWLFNAVLIASVFSFSGFNLPIHPAVNEPVKTELVESNIQKPFYCLKWNTTSYCKTQLSNSLSTIKSFHVWGLINHFNVVNVKYKSYQSKTQLYNIASIEPNRIIPTSTYEGEAPLLIVS